MFVVKARGHINWEPILRIPDNLVVNPIYLVYEMLYELEACPLVCLVVVLDTLKESLDQFVFVNLLHEPGVLSLPVRRQLLAASLLLHLVEGKPVLFDALLGEDTARSEPRIRLQLDERGLEICLRVAQVLLGSLERVVLEKNLV